MSNYRYIDLTRPQVDSSTGTVVQAGPMISCGLVHPASHEDARRCACHMTPSFRTTNIPELPSPGVVQYQMFMVHVASPGTVNVNSYVPGATYVATSLAGKCLPGHMLGNGPQRRYAGTVLQEQHGAPVQPTGAPWPVNGSNRSRYRYIDLTWPQVASCVGTGQ